MKKYLPFLFALVAGTCWAANPGALFDFLAGGIVDEDGAPLTGGTAYFYDAGYAGNAAHARNIWTSANRTGTATSIILGGTGHPPGGALVYGDGLYDVVVKDSATNTVFTALAVDATYVGTDAIFADKTYDIASSGWVTCAVSATPTNVLALGTGKTDSYTYTYEVKDATATQHICINSAARPSELVYVYYDAADGYIKCYNNATDTVYVRVHLWPVQ